MDPLRDSPHCAHDRCKLLQLEDQPGEGYAVHCPECGANGPIDGVPEFAVHKWNRRGELTDIEIDSETHH